MECVACAVRSLRLSSSRQASHILPRSSTQHVRHESTARRLRSKLRIQPAASFTPGPEEKQDHIIYNPPSSLPNIYNTPALFLPPSDPRRPKPSTTMATNTNDQPQSTLQSLANSRSRPLSHMPLLTPPHERKYHLTPTDVAEIRRLRAQDHRTWTVKKLAAKFECSESFIRLCAFSVAAKEEQEAKITAIKSRWGRTKREAREDRARRKEAWGMEA